MEIINSRRPDSVVYCSTEQLPVLCCTGAHTETAAKRPPKEHQAFETGGVRFGFSARQ